MHPTLDRRRFLGATGLAGAVLLAPGGMRAALAAGDPPQTGFEQRAGDGWTTHDEELTFLEQVAAGSQRVRIEEIGRTLQDRPLHLVTLGAPSARDAVSAQSGPIVLFVGSQHGNEPAGRETALKLLRDLAFTTDPLLVEQLRKQTVLFVPSANPDGRARNTRGNAAGVDINRDHLNLATPEARALAAVVRDANPDVVLDLHEYGPQVPVLYDDDVLYLWTRNLNADAAVRDLGRTLAEQYIKRDSESAGYSADEYGLQRVDVDGVDVAGNRVPGGYVDVAQTAGDEDEGICRNTMGLRHAVGILVESATSGPKTTNPTRPEEIGDGAAEARRRVASQMVVVHSALRFMREQGEVAKFASDGAPLRKAREGAEATTPVYFGGADNDPPEPSQIQDPPPVAYRLTRGQAEDLAEVFALHAIKATPQGEDVIVSMAQPAEPLIPLLLDGRGERNAVDGEPIYAS